MQICLNTVPNPATKLNNAVEMCLILDKCVQDVATGYNPGQLHDNARQALLDGLYDTIKFLRDNGVPDLTGIPLMEYLITISPERMTLQQSKMELQGEPQPGQPVNGVITKKVIFEHRFPLLPLQKWAELYDISPNTVYQWTNRNRIKSVKTGNSVLIPLLQHDPNRVALPKAKFLSYLLNDKPVPDTIRNEFTFLQAEGLDSVHVVPEKADYVVVVQSKKDGKPHMERLMLNQERRDRFEKVMTQAGYENQEQNYFINPFRSLHWKSEQRPPIIIPGRPDVNSFLGKYPMIGYMGRLEADDIWPVIETGVKEEDKNLFRVKGNVLLYTKNNLDQFEKRQVDGFASEKDNRIMEDIQKVREHSGWFGYSFWTRDIVYLDEMRLNIVHADDAVLFLQTLPLRIFNIAYIRPRCVVFRTDNMSEAEQMLLQSAGYKFIPMEQLCYAYIV